jgi:hypothetical protein
MSQLNHEEGSCDRYWELMSAVADREASKDEEAELREHVAGCTECAEAFAFIKSVTQSAHEMPRVAPPPSLRQAILASTSRKRTLLDTLRAAFVQHRLGIGLSAAAIAAIALYMNHGAGSQATGPEIASNGNPPISTHIEAPKPGVRAPKAVAKNPEPSHRTMRSPQPVVRVASAETGTRAAPELVHRTGPSMRPGFIGSRVMVAVPPFDPRESTTGTKPTRREADPDLGLRDVASSETTPPGTSPSNTVALNANSPTLVENVAPKKVALLTDETKGRIQAAFDRDRLRKLMDQARIKSEGSDDFTLVKGKF